MVDLSALEITEMLSLCRSLIEKLSAAEQRLSVAERAASNLCIECGQGADEQHHVIPQSQGGRATVPLCSACHGKAHGIGRAANFRELTKEGQARARAKGAVIGRPPKFSEEVRQEIRQKKAAGESISELARQYGLSRPGVYLILKANVGQPSA